MTTLDMTGGHEGIVPGVRFIDMGTGEGDNGEYGEGGNFVVTKNQAPKPPSGSDDLRREIPGVIVEILPTPPGKGTPPWIHPGSDLPAKTPTTSTIQ